MAYNFEKELLPLDSIDGQNRINTRRLSQALGFQHQTVMDLITVLEPQLEILDHFDYIHPSTPRDEKREDFPYTFLSKSQAFVFLASLPHNDTILRVTQNLAISFSRQERFSEF